MEKHATFGQAIYSDIDKNEYLAEIYENALFNYSQRLLHIPDEKIVDMPVNIDDALRFADVLSKSEGFNNSDKHKITAIAHINFI